MSKRLGLLALSGTFLALNSQASLVVAAWGTALICSLGLMLTRSSNLSIPNGLAEILSLPILLLCIGLPGFYRHGLSEVGKDLFYFSGPIVYITFGYLVFERVRQWDLLLQPFLAVGLGTAIQTGVNLFLSRDALAASSRVEDYRGVSGTGSFVSLIAIVTLGLVELNGIPAAGLSRYRSVRVAVYAVCAAAIVCSLSRTLLILLALGFLISRRPANLLKGLKTGKGLVLAVCFFAGGALLFTLPHASDGITGAFLQKFGNSTSEVRVHAYETYEDINNNWRGFEAYRAQKTLDSFSPLEQFIGGGFGSTVDLGFAMDLGGPTLFQFVPTLHNGFMYILVKTGIVGITLFAAFLCQIFFLGIRAYSRDSSEFRLVSLLLLWTALVFALTQGVMTGIYNKGALAPSLFLLGAACSGRVQLLRHQQSSVQRNKGYSDS